MATPEKNLLRFSVAEARFETGAWMPPHSHDDISHFAFCISGSVQEFCEGETITVRPTAVSYMPMGVSHANRFLRDTRLFLLLMRHEWFARYPQMEGRMNRPMECHGGSPVAIGRRMYQEFHQQDELTELALEGLLLELSAEMLRDKRSRTEVAPPLWLRRVQDYLHTHFAEEMDMVHLATIADVHPSHLIRTFRQFYRCTMSDYLRRLRIEYACHLLSSSSLPLTEIALKVGFSDQSHFCHVFKRGTGVSPATFRNQIS